MKKVLRIAKNVYNPTSTSINSIGGVQIQVYRIVRALSKNNVYQDVITSENIDFGCDNVSCYYPKRNILNSATVSLVLSCINHLNKNRAKYDVVQIHADGGLSPLIIGEIITYIYKIPVVYTFHCCRNVTYKPKKIEFLTKHLINYFEKRCIKHSAHNVFLSDYVVDELLKKHIIPNTDKISVIGDSIDTAVDDFFIQKNDKEKSEIVYVGRLSREKGWDIFVECADKLKDKNYIFKMYGSGPDLKNFQDEINKNNIKNIVHFGSVPNEEILHVLADADIVVIPSYYEELGSVVLEAGIMKKTVIASSIGALTEILSDGRGYTVPVGDVDGFCEHIVNIIENNNYDSGPLLYDYICKNYSMANAVKKYTDIYNKV